MDRAGSVTASVAVAWGVRVSPAFLQLAESALMDGDVRRAAFHVRAAEFFVRGDDPDKQQLRARFVELLLRSRSMNDRESNSQDLWMSFFRRLPLHRFLRRVVRRVSPC